MYRTLLILYCILLAAINFFHGFGEDPDSMRLVLASYKFMNGLPLEASRSWGFPLYELLTYLLIASGKNGLLLAKIASLCYSIGALLLFHTIVCRIVNKPFIAFLIALLYCSNPLIIISGNTILETSMHLLALMAICYFVFTVSQQSAAKTTLSLHTHVRYGLLIGIATLIRPDNSFYFPAFYLYLFAGRFVSIGLKQVLAAAIPALVIGLVPYYLLGYPVFSELPGEQQHPFLAGIKTMVLILGLPFICLCLVLFTRMRERHVLNPFKRWSTWINRQQYHYAGFLLILLLFVLLRVFLMPDELEYGLMSWSIVLLMIAYVYKRIVFREVVLVLMIACTLLPNFLQLHFFREKNYNYYFSPGITKGVFQQERERRVYAAVILKNGEGMLQEFTDSRFHQPIQVRVSLYYDDCADCIVYTTFRELQANNKKGFNSTSLSRKRFVVYPVFNVSRGWRNFIGDETIPEVSLEHLVLAK